MAFILLFIALFAALAVLPQMWVKNVIKENSAERADIPGSGGELARHLLDGMKLEHVKVEETKLGDHYDPAAKAVRLLPDHFNGRSLAAVVIAAHEVGHAMQDATGYKPLRARTRLAKQAHIIEIIGTALMLAAPLAAIVARTPHVLLMEMAAGALILGFTILIHAATLPVEFDASFGRALPVLEAGGYVSQKDMPAARRLLKAAAYTYVAAAAMSLVDVMRWLRLLRL